MRKIFFLDHGAPGQTVMRSSEFLLLSFNAMFFKPILIGMLLVCSIHVDNSHALVNDRPIKIRTAADVVSKRKELIRFIWGSSGFPHSKQPQSVERNVLSPVMNLPNLERVDTLHIAMDKGLRGLSHHFIPQKTNQRLVVLHLGHTNNCTFNDGAFREPDIGMSRTLRRLLSRGFSVLAVYMPHQTIEDCTGRHEEMFSLATSGNPMKFFLETTLASLNYLKLNFPNYSDYSMIGLSGGGWTTTVYAAIDPRIRYSIPVAGTVPLYLRYSGYNHDREQILDSFYNIAGYLDLYILGSHGQGRQQIQVLNRYDDEAFGERQHWTERIGMPFKSAVRDYESRVKSTLKKLGQGVFRVYIDEVAPGHMISDHTIENVIISTLR